MSTRPWERRPSELNCRLMVFYGFIGIRIFGCFYQINNEWVDKLRAVHHLKTDSETVNKNMNTDQNKHLCIFLSKRTLMTQHAEPCPSFFISPLQPMFFSCIPVKQIGSLLLFSLCLPPSLLSFSSPKPSSSSAPLSWQFWMRLLWMSRLKDCYLLQCSLSQHGPFKGSQDIKKRCGGGGRGEPTSTPWHSTRALIRGEFIIRDLSSSLSGFWTDIDQKSRSEDKTFLYNMLEGSVVGRVV